MKRNRKRVHLEQPVSWLPVDSRLMLPLFSFGHVHGAAKFFLTVEMLFAAAVVCGTFVIALLRFIS